MNLSMKDRVAVVTGGSKGIGIAVARRFATKSGAKVAILARGAADLKTAREALSEESELTVRDYVCDVSKAADIAGTHDRIVADFGKVDILVNNAGTSQTGKFADISDAAWQADLDLKLFAAIRFARVAVPPMRARRWGRIINVLGSPRRRRAPRVPPPPSRAPRAWRSPRYSRASARPTTFWSTRSPRSGGIVQRSDRPPPPGIRNECPACRVHRPRAPRPAAFRSGGWARRRRFANLPSASSPPMPPVPT